MVFCGNLFLLPNVLDEPHGYLARSVLLGARSVTSNRVGSSALLGSFFILYGFVEFSPHLNVV